MPLCGREGNIKPILKKLNAVLWTEFNEKFSCWTL